MSCCHNIYLTRFFIVNHNFQQDYLHLQLRVCNELAKHWECKLLFNESIPNEKLPRLVDVGAVLTSGQDYVFPDHYSSHEDETRLVIEIKLACMQAGFNLVRRSSKSEELLTHIKSKFSRYIRLTCQKGIKYRPSKKNIENVRDSYYTNTFLCHDGCNCKFAITLAYRSSDKRWLINKPTRKNRE